MASNNLNKIFLSASIPYENRDRRFFNTADVIAIRDCVRALATVVIPKAHLIWGGHPSITPLIRYVLARMNSNLRQHVTLYQSRFFEQYFPPDNFDFEDVRLIEVDKGREQSLSKMRESMIGENKFVAGIFIGGMEGVWDEYIMFRRYHPKALLLPIASTGAAAKEIFAESSGKRDHDLADNYAYMAMFRRLLSNFLI